MKRLGCPDASVLISPLGDLVSRRKMLLCLITVSTALSIGLALTKSFIAFEVISFIVAMATVVPQVLLTLTADLSKPERRARGLSIVLSGLVFGIVVRPTTFVVANCAARASALRPHRSVLGLEEHVRVHVAARADVASYWMAVGVQTLMLLVLYFTVPDLPPKNTGLSYFGILGTMARLCWTSPVLVQVSLIGLTTSATFGSMWASASTHCRLG